MKEMTRIESVASEAAVLVGVQLPNHQHQPHQQSKEDPLEELEGLANTAGAHVVGKVFQRLKSP